MVKAKMYNMQGKEIGEVALPAALFEVPIKTGVVHSVVKGIMGNRRVAIAHTKTRGEVSGGGKKPWKQKGTGRARHGSTRSPIWIGGGVTFGPRSNRNFSVKINRKARRNALRMVLSDKAARAKVLILDDLVLPEGKTKYIAKLAASLPIGKKTLLVLPAKHELVMRAVRNLPNVKAVTANALPLEEVLRYETLLMPQSTVPVLEHLFGN